MMKKNKRNKIIALIATCINTIFVFDSLYWLYRSSTSGLFAIRTPDSVLLVSALLGMIGIYKSMLLYEGKFRIKPFLIATFAIWIILFVHNEVWRIFLIAKL